MQGVLAMLHSKAQRHAAAWERYQASRQQSEQRHNAAAAASAASSKASLETINSQVEQQMSVLADDRVMVLDEVQLHQVGAVIAIDRGCQSCSCHKMLPLFLLLVLDCLQQTDAKHAQIDQPTTEGGALPCGCSTKRFTMELRLLTCAGVAVSGAAAQPHHCLHRCAGCWAALG